MSISIEQTFNYFKTNGDFKIYGDSSNNMILNAVNVINQLKYWYWIKFVDPKRGFITSKSKQMTEIMNLLKEDYHTGVTTGYMMRFLQMMAITLIDGDDNENTSCTICTSDCGLDLKTKTILECGHVFHPNCIKNWYTFSNKCGSCPNCRQDTLPNYSEYPVTNLDLTNQYIRKEGRKNQDPI
jgi:hypothetical protein